MAVSFQLDPMVHFPGRRRAIWQLIWEYIFKLSQQNLDISGGGSACAGTSTGLSGSSAGTAVTRRRRSTVGLMPAGKGMPSTASCWLLGISGTKKFTTVSNRLSPCPSVRFTPSTSDRGGPSTHTWVLVVCRSMLLAY